MTLIDILDMYCILHNQNNNMMLMLQDYILDQRIDRQAMNMAIITKLGACRPLTTNTTVFKVMLEEFFNRYNYNIGKLLDTMYYEYDPLTNKNIERRLDEESTENTDDKNNQSFTGNVTEHRESTGDIDNTDTYTTNNVGTDNINRVEENQVSAYDVSTYQPKEKTTTDSDEDTTSNTTHSGATTSDIKSDVDTDTDTTHTQTDARLIDKDGTHNLVERIKGKEGDDSYQTLIEQERELAQFNIFNWIIQQMRRELFLLVY